MGKDARNGTPSYGPRPWPSGDVPRVCSRAEEMRTARDYATARVTPSPSLGARRSTPRSGARPLEPRLSSGRPDRPDDAAVDRPDGPLVVRGRLSRGFERRRRALAAFGLALAAIVLTFYVAPSAGSSSQGFSDVGVEGLVAAAGSGLVVDGQPFHAIGYNDYRLTSAPGGAICDGGYGAIDDDELGERLDRAAAAGATVVRTWFFQSTWDPDRDGSGDWEAFDRVITAAAERGLRVVPVLANHWGDCVEGGVGKDFDFYAGGFREPHGPHALAYRDYAETIVSRYAGSPAIAFWQLINEPEATGSGGCDEVAAAEAMTTFAAEMAGVVRTADPDHLVSLGTIGGGQCGTAGTNYMAAHEAIDICSIHVYDDEGAETSPATTLPGDSTNGVAARLSACEAAGKPVVAGEIGFAADLDESGLETGVVTDTTLANRAGFLGARVEAMGELGLDGFLVWQLDSRAPLSDGADRYAVGPCDPVEDVIAAAAGTSAPECTEA
jgi:mannan endo-1,4-beta-mannosidase